MAVEIEFMGWGRPGLRQAAERLVSHGISLGEGASSASADLSSVVVVTPGGRAGRRLLEIMVELAERRGVSLNPPRIVTTGGVADVLCPSVGRVADELTQRCVWGQSLAGLDEASVKTLTPTPPAAGDSLGWMALGQRVSRLASELAAERLSFAEVLKRSEQWPDFVDESRWRALASAQRAYLSRLKQLGLVDAQQARLDAIDAGAIRFEGELWLVATADLTGQVREMARQAAKTGRVVALVHAPQSLRERFDEFGGIVAERWRDAAIDIADEQIEQVEKPGDQVNAVLCEVASYGGGRTAEQITVGVLDEEVAGLLEQRLPLHGVPARAAAGRAVSRTGPAKLLRAAADYLAERRFNGFASLIRHPDVEQHLLRAVSQSRGTTHRAIGWWQQLLDEYFTEYLQEHVTGRWLGHESIRRELSAIYAVTHGWLGELADGSARPLNRWAQPIVDLLTATYGGRPLNRFDEGQRVVIESCRAIAEVAQAAYRLREEISPVVSASDALRLVADEADRMMIAPEPMAAAVELLGWLELPLDDAEALIVTGFNEGRVPESVNADEFLPNSLRSRLGLVDNERRYARDAYALSAILASKQRVKLIVGRRTSDGDPLQPSRLLFACERAAAVARVRRWFGPAEAAAGRRVTIEPPITPGGAKSQFAVPLPVRRPEPITTLRVTDFSAYLACPYRYYLERVLGLNAVDDQATELDGGEFGTLAHQVLAQFGGGELRDSTDARAISAALSALLDEAVESKFGRSPMPAVRVQAEQLRSRLERFAQWQARWAADGWRIEHVELSIDRNAPAPLEIDDGLTVGLTGKIDRIDHRPSTGERVIFDYKTGDSGDKPEKTHIHKGQWIDLQLPLYRRLARHVGIKGEVRVGYIVLPRDLSAVQEHMADWAAADFEDAERVAKEVARKIVEQRFWPPVFPGPTYSSVSRICMDDQLGRIVEPSPADSARGGRA